MSVAGGFTGVETAQLGRSPHCGGLQRGRLAACGAPDEVITEQMVAECFSMRALVMRHPRAACPRVVPTP